MKIMVVEDSRAVRERILALLNGIVHESALLEAGTAAEAIKKMRTYQPEIVILDLLLPDGHGLDVLQTIKTIQASTQVLIMTNAPLEQYKKRALQLGAIQLFDKVKDFTRVIDTVAALAGQSVSVQNTRI